MPTTPTEREHDPVPDDGTTATGTDLDAALGDAEPPERGAIDLDVPLDSDFEVPEADLIEQRRAVPLDEEEREHQ
ncbi:MAG: hypothetical protein AAFP84_05020 [Actinomycetota bacterium]